MLLKPTFPVYCAIRPLIHIEAGFLPGSFPCPYSIHLSNRSATGYSDGPLVILSIYSYLFLNRELQYILISTTC